MILAEVAPAAGAGAAADALVVTIDLLLLFAVIWCLRKAWPASFGALIEGIANVLGRVPLAGGAMKRAARALDTSVESALAQAEGNALKGATRSYEGLRFLTVYTADTLWGLAGDVLHGSRAIVDVAIPRAVTRSGEITQRRTIPRIHSLEERQRAEAKARSGGIDTVRVELRQRTLVEQRGIDYIGKEAIPRLRERVRADEQSLARERTYTHRTLAERIKEMWRSIALGIGGAAAITVLEHAWPFWRCSNVRNTSRFLCRFPTDGLNLLLGLSFELVAVTELCQLVGLLSSFSRQVEPLLLDFVKAENVLIKCPHALYPPDLGLGKSDLPAVVEGLPLAA